MLGLFTDSLTCWPKVEVLFGAMRLEAGAKGGESGLVTSSESAAVINLAQVEFCTPFTAIFQVCLPILLGENKPERWEKPKAAVGHEVSEEWYFAKDLEAAGALSSIEDCQILRT